MLEYCMQYDLCAHTQSSGNSFVHCFESEGRTLMRNGIYISCPSATREFIGTSDMGNMPCYGCCNALHAGFHLNKPHSICFQLKSMCIICAYKNPQITITECYDGTACIPLFSLTHTQIRLEGPSDSKRAI
jgi:hypothetical protein